MNPIRPQRLMVAPPTLEKQVDVVRAINALVTQYDDEQQQRRRAEGAADRAAFEKLRRDCEALEQAMHDAYREAAQIILQSRARRRANAHGAVTDALRKRGYNPNEPRVPKHHTGGGEWTRNTVAAADNVSVRPGEPLPIPIHQGWDKPQEHKAPEHKPPEYESPERRLFTDFYELSIRQPIRDLAELIAHPEDIPNAIASVAPGLGPGEVPVVLAEFLTYIRTLRAGAAAGATVGTRAEALAAESEAADASTVSLRRPYIRRLVREEVEAAAPRTPDGRPIDPNTGQPIDGTPDFGHKPGNEFWREKQAAEAEG